MAKSRSTLKDHFIQGVGLPRVIYIVNPCSHQKAAEDEDDEDEEAKL
jgi:hypothetical protein